MAHRTTPNTCKVCGQIFLARILDLERGVGGTCSPRCAGRVRGQKSSLAQASHSPQDGKPTRKEIARSFLDKYGYVTNGMFNQVGRLHVGRNACSELKGEYAEKGFIIRFIPNKNFMDNKWVLEPMQATAGVQ